MRKKERESVCVRERVGVCVRERVWMRESMDERERIGEEKQPKGIFLQPKLFL